MKVLMASLQPVGGIRTFLRYTYGQPVFSDVAVTLLAPGEDLTAYFRAHIPEDQFRVQPISRGLKDLTSVVRSELRKRSYSLIHSHGLRTGAAVEIARIGSSVPHLLTVHDVFLPSTFHGIRGQLMRMGLSALLRRCSAVHAVGQDCGDNFREHMTLIKPERVHVILNGIDTQRFADAEPEDCRARFGLDEAIGLVGFFGRFMAQKGFRTLVDAVGILIRDGFSRPFRIVTFGLNGYVREDYQYLREKGLGEFFIQHPGTDEPERWMKAMDVIAMPSRWEACPLQPMEALTAGVPFVGTDCIGLKEVIRGTPSLVVRPGDPAALAKALANSMLPAVRASFEAYAPEATDRFCVKPRAVELRDLYMALSGSNPS